jgi:TRAP-type C4-dicarboxylate transport system permease small subunit
VSFAGLADRIDRGIRLAALALAGLSAACVAAMFAIIVASVTMRYAVKRPLAFTEELTGLLLAASIFLIVPHVTASHLNIRVTLLADRLAGGARRLLHLVGQLVLAAFLAVFLNESLRFVGLALRFNEKTELTRLAIAPFKMLMAGCIGFALLIALWQMLRPPPEGEGLKI